MDISVIIPVKNGEQTLDRCLTAIKQQSIAPQTEIIVLDSCSTDSSVAIAKSYGSIVVNIPEGAFNHGSTRNIGVSHAKGMLLYFTVQDAYIAEQNQLEVMASHFYDQELMAVTGMQAVTREKGLNPALWFQRFSKASPVYRHLSTKEYDQHSGKDQLRLTSEWDNVNAMYRKTALEQVPFANTEFGEDKLWAKNALRAGMKICFNPSLVVWHYHHSNFKYAFRLQYTVNYQYYQFFRIKPALRSFFKPLITSWYLVWRTPALSFVQKTYWSIHNFGRLLGQTMSTVMFLLTVSFSSERVLKRSFYFFCKQIPQGTIK